MSRALTRRGLVAAAPPAVVAATLPALAAGAHPDAALLALREPYERTLADFNAVLTAKGEIDEQVFAGSRSYPDFQGLDRQCRRLLRLLRGDHCREAIEPSLGCAEVDRLEDVTADANGAPGAHNTCHLSMPPWTCC